MIGMEDLFTEALLVDAEANTTVVDQTNRGSGPTEQLHDR